jgi:uncharacterized membrane protein
MNEHGELRRFPRFGGFLLGVGIGGFFDGIVFHQLLQWHHMLSSAGYPPDSVTNLSLNTFWDGLFHTLTYICVAVGVGILWRHARREHVRWSGKLLAGMLLLGWGAFNVAEGIINHHVLGLHHVNETVPQSQWLAWDLGFLVWGGAMIAAGTYLARRGRRETDESRMAAAGVDYAATLR